MRGIDKLTLPVDGEPVLRQQTQAARAVSQQVIVALPAWPHPRHDLVSDLDVVRLPVADAAMGMSYSLRAGINVLPASATAVLILLADLPELTSADMRTVIECHQNRPDAKIVQGITTSGAPGHPILFVSELFQEFNQLAGDVGAKSVIAAHRSDRISVALPGNRAILDLDTPEDWADWRARTGR